MHKKQGDTRKGTVVKLEILEMETDTINSRHPKRFLQLRRRNSLSAEHKILLNLVKSIVI